MEKRWRILEADERQVSDLADSLKIEPAVSKMLVCRGIHTYEAARSYFQPRLDDLHSPWQMKDMDKAVDRVIAALRNGERILVYGDYDVDGTTAVACMFRFLNGLAKMGQVDFYIPHRYKEGYGISRAGVEFARDHSFTLVIALDCGIKSTELISLAASWSIDFIVCDHHIPGHDLPPAYAILNPKQKDCPYPFKELCGCGVGFKLITAIAERAGLPADHPYQFLDLVATAIAADIVPITGENRIIAHFGLLKVNETPCQGIRSLIEQSGSSKKLNITNLVFMIAPRVNAAGRMDDARKAVQLFVEDDAAKAKAWAEQLQSDNTERKEADSSITEEALALIQGDDKLLARRSTVLFQPHWHKGVVGIVASRLIEQYYRPTIILTGNGEVISGSARSIPGFNIHEGLDQCKDLLIGFGGHYFAAGMTLQKENFTAFSERFEQIVASTVPPELFTPEIEIDDEINFDEISPKLHRIISQMEPFGPGNPKPHFIARKVMDTGRSRIVKSDHIKFELSQGSTQYKGIGFGLARKFSLMDHLQPVDITFHIEENVWRETRSLQLQISDIKISS